MHITLVTHYFPPEVNAPAQRAMEHARCWVDAGYEVTIVTAIPSHPYGRPYNGYVNKTIEETIDGIRVLRLRTLLGSNSGTFGRIKNYLSFAFAIRLNISKIGSTDVVISTSPQFFCGLAGYFVKRSLAVPWILEIRDIWPDSIIAVGAARPSLATKAVSKLAKWAYSNADAIVSVSPGFNDHFLNYGVPQSKITLIPNGIQTDLKPVPCEVSDFPDLARFKGLTIAAFIGTVGMAHGLRSILDAAKLLEKDSDIGILIVGSGAESEHLKLVIKENNHSNAIIMDQLSREQILKLWSLVSISIVHLKKNPVFESVIPTKLLEAMAMEKSIVLGVEGTAADILNSANAGIAVEPENPMAIADAIRHLSANPTEAQCSAKQGRSFVVQNYDRTKMAQRYLDLVDTLCKC